MVSDTYTSILYALQFKYKASQSDDDADFYGENYQNRPVISVQSTTTPTFDEVKTQPAMCRNELPARPLPKAYTESMKMPSIAETLAKLKPRANHSVTLGTACK